MLDGDAWQPVGIPSPPDETRVDQPFLLVGNGSAFLGSPLRRYDPDAQAWIELDVNSTGDGNFDGGMAVDGDGNAYFEMRGPEGVYQIAPDRTGRALFTCADVPTPEMCLDSDGELGGPTLLQNGMNGAVYFQSGGGVYVRVWRIVDGEITKVGDRDTDNYGWFSLAIDGAGTVYSVEMIVSGGDGVLLRHESGNDWTWLIDCAYYDSPCLDPLTNVEAGPDGRVYAYTPNSVNWSGILRLGP